MNGTKDIAQRQINAITAFVDAVVSQFGFTQVEAEGVFRVYQKEKLVKIDAVIGTYVLATGQAWEKEVMLNALEALAAKPKRYKV